MDIETVKSTPYEVISDKTLSHQDYLFKLIIIGDTGTVLHSLLSLKPARDFAFRQASGRVVCSTA